MTSRLCSKFLLSWLAMLCPNRKLLFPVAFDSVRVPNEKSDFYSHGFKYNELLLISREIKSVFVFLTGSGVPSHSELLKIVRSVGFPLSRLNDQNDYLTQIMTQNAISILLSRT